MAISIKNGWSFAAEQLAKEIDPSATNLTNAKIAELIKSGKYSAAIELAQAAGLDASSFNISNGWIDTFTRIDTKVNP